MTSAPVALNRAARRKAGIKQATPENVPFQATLLQRREMQREDGAIVAQSYFALLAPSGKILMEETPDGDKPVIIASVPMVVRKGVLLTSPTLVTR